MKHKIFLLLLFFTIAFHAQKSNPVGFIDAFITMQDNFLLGYSLNYQYKNSLFTYRYSYQNENRLYYLYFIPLFKKINQTEEFSLMYGYRKTFDIYSLSFSIGGSYNVYKDFSQPDNKVLTQTDFGFPLQVSIKFFKKKKKRYRIYGLFPVGKPVSFGRSIGLRLLANISDHNYFGVALTYGFGWHKQYFDKPESDSSNN